LKFRQHAIDAVHVQPEQVLDPVVGLGPSARRRAHRSEPRQDIRRRGVAPRGRLVGDPQARVGGPRQREDDPHVEATPIPSRGLVGEQIYVRMSRGEKDQSAS
jgi:hypothetical protein